ncbi:MAG: 2-amino-4-hydroxy-6-hydroxymethyldihydropteridine diphosphokinase [Kutzneria sp.]|nr:2-amino-4-hydroxy-6-hydroxymethyldihydropteridine diphosphokinase [Kutzneria sp.]MBV9844114.1 2-amino-4-hydroxy-6-hydroxymethyldihydropteridine diphosphokinase [Kutzneria sp.]
MTRAVLSLGSNLGDRLGHLQRAVDGFHDDLVAVSPVYETTPWGVRDQGDFLNAVLLVAADNVDEWTWLRRGQRLEDQADRRRTLRWGPRTLDVDVVSVDQVRSDHPDLLLPHPGTPVRATVLVPWLDVEPDAVLPGHGRVADLVAGLDTEGVRRRDDLRLEWR